ncbi:hypothetical protein ACTXG5_11090 [Mycobacterium sp. Dal123C01]|uniref:hypothetical protein n=1 Tax=Mycobacterium sp. Dal123C01 TaxID=3457577 RepID=UPI00403EEDB5
MTSESKVRYVRCAGHYLEGGKPVGGPSLRSDMVMVTGLAGVVVTLVDSRTAAIIAALGAFSLRM